MADPIPADDLLAAFADVDARRIHLLKIAAGELSNFRDPFHRDKITEYLITKDELMWLSAELATICRAIAHIRETGRSDGQAG